MPANSLSAHRPSSGQLAGLQALQPVLGPDMTITAGNASQLSDGSSASILMEAKLAEKKGLNPLGRYVGMAVAGTEPDEMGIGPVFAIPKLLQRFGLKMDDIGIWELNEAFAVQVLYCRDKLGIPNELLNVNGVAQNAMKGSYSGPTIAVADDPLLTDVKLPVKSDRAKLVRILEKLISGRGFISRRLFSLLFLSPCSVPLIHVP